MPCGHIQPENQESDKRHWITGITRVANHFDSNLHNHSSNAATKIPSQIDTDICKAVIANTQLRT